MIAASFIGRKGSVGFSRKKLNPIAVHPMILYPLSVALNSNRIDETFVVTEHDKITKMTRDHGANIIGRLAELCTSRALREDILIHGYYWI